MLECKTYNFTQSYTFEICLTYVDNLVLLPFEKYHTKRNLSYLC